MLHCQLHRAGLEGHGGSRGHHRGHGVLLGVRVHAGEISKDESSYRRSTDPPHLYPSVSLSSPLHPSLQTQHRDQIKFRNENQQCICPAMATGNPMLAPPVAVMQKNPGMTFQYPQINHQTGEAQGIPHPQTQYPAQSQYPPRY